MRRKPIGNEEYSRIVDFLRNDDIRETTRRKWLRLFTILYLTGLRVNEAASLRYGQVMEGMERGEFQVKTSKTGTWRRIYLSENAIHLLDDVMKEDSENFESDHFVFHPWRFPKRRVNVDRFTKDANAYLEKIFASRDYTTHSFRSGLVTDMVLRSGNVKIAQEYIAHKSVATTLRYVRPTEEDIRASLVR